MGMRVLYLINLPKTLESLTGFMGIGLMGEGINNSVDAHF